MKSRLNIGVLIDDVNAVFSNQAIKGAEFGAVAMDADLFIIPGMCLDDKDISGKFITIFLVLNDIDTDPF